MPRAVDGSQLCLVLEATGPSAGEALRSALNAADIAAVVFTAGAPRTFEAGHVASLTVAAQNKGVAALVAGDSRLARTVRADGVHLPWSEAPLAAYREARDWLGTRAIVGADAGSSRHDAMELGEAGADYVGFGLCDAAGDPAAAAARRLELVAWWSEIFEVPVVALDVESAAEASALAAAGADFIAARVPSGRTGADVQHWVREMAAALGPAADVA